MDAKYKSRKSNTLLKIFICFLLSLIIIIPMSDLPVYSDDTSVHRDKYGLQVRSNKGGVPTWYPDDVDSFEGFHDSEVPRVVDMADIIKPDEESELMSKIAQYSADIEKDIVIVTDKFAYGLGHETFCYDFYDFNGYGIGRNYEGICLFVCMDPNDRGWWVGATGYDSRDMYNEIIANKLDDKLYNYMASGKYAEGISDWVDNIYNEYRRYLHRDPATLPPWYPKDIESFESFQDSDRSRVVDFADVLTDDQESRLKERISDICSKISTDIVVVTDNSDYELGMRKYVSDFYEYNGYGLGTDYEAMCLFIRTGDPNPDLFPGGFGKTAMSLDDKHHTTFYNIAYDDIKAKRYYDGIEKWMDAIVATYTKGFPGAPEWYPTLEEKENYVRSHNVSVPRVYDSIKGEGAFTSEQESVLNDKAKEISDKYEVDVAIHTVRSGWGLSSEIYMEDYYYYNGFGYGEDYNAIIFYIFDEYNRINIELFGNIKSELSDVNYSRMLEQSQEAEDYYKAADLFLSNLDHWERTGRVPRTMGQWVFAAIVSSLVGLFFGKISLSKAKKNMVTVHEAYGATNYIAGSDSFENGVDTLVSKDVQKTKIPRPTYSGSSSSRSSHSSSHHRSTYHSSSRGSSGRSHSGSGRRF